MAGTVKESQKQPFFRNLSVLSRVVK